MRQGRVIFCDCFFRVFLEPRNFSAYSVQAIMFRVKSGGALEKRLCSFDGTDSHIGLRRGKLQTQITRHGIGGLRVELCALVGLAVELVGVSKLGSDVRLRTLD